MIKLKDIFLGVILILVFIIVVIFLETLILNRIVNLY